MALDRNRIRTVMTLVGTAAPVVAKYLKDHPEIGQTVSDAVAKLLKRRTAGPAGMIETIGVLREQVAYLRSSADDDAETARAQSWSKRLDNLDHAAQMLRDGASRSETKAVRDRLTTVRGEILAAFIAEQAQDAQDRDRPQLES